MHTTRLELRPLSAAAASALLGDRRAAVDVIAASLPKDWPQGDLLDILPMQAAAGADEVRYGVWLMIERTTNTVVGDVGFLGPPDDGLLEIGFSVIPDRRRRGYATEAAGAMVAWALREPGVVGVIARCDGDNVASMGVLQRAGFERTEEVDGQIRWVSAGATEAHP